MKNVGRLGKLGKLAVHCSAVLLLAGASAAYAGNTYQSPYDGPGGSNNLLGGWCKLFSWFPLCCSPTDVGDSGPHGVPEPGMLGLLGMSAASAAVAGYRRRRRK